MSATFVTLRLVAEQFADHHPADQLKAAESFVRRGFPRIEGRALNVRWEPGTCLRCILVDVPREAVPPIEVPYFSGHPKLALWKRDEGTR